MNLKQLEELFKPETLTLKQLPIGQYFQFTDMPYEGCTFKKETNVYFVNNGYVKDEPYGKFPIYELNCQDRPVKISTEIRFKIDF